MSAENRSEWAVAASAVAAPLLLWGCSVSWLWLLAGGVLAVVIYGVLCYRQPSAQLTEVTRVVFGKQLGGVLLWLQLTALALAAGWLLRGTGDIVPNVADGYPWIPVVLSVLALAGAWRGRKAALSSGAVLFWLVAVTIGVVTVFSLPQMKLERIKPEGTIIQIIPTLLLFLIPTLCLYCRKPEARGTSVRLNLVMFLSGVLASLVTTGCLSARLISGEALPFFTLAASCRLLGHAARFDAVLCMTVSAAVYCLLILMLNFCRQITPGRKTWPLLVFIFLALGSSWLVNWIPAIWIGAYLVIFWVILPVCCVCFGTEKKIEKNEKSC